MATKTILIVGPDKEVGALLAYALVEEGHDVNIVDSLQQAKESLSNVKFDLIITEAFDQDHPYLFNSAFINELKQAAVGTPIVLCSTSPSTYFLRPGRYGLAGVIPRPFLFHRALAQVNTVLQQGRCGA